MTDATILKTIEYLNEVTQSDYSPKYPATVNALPELMKLGYNLTDFKKVIDKKYKDFWVDYDTIWSFFEKVFSMEDGEIQQLMNTWLEETFNLKGFTPNYEKAIPWLSWKRLSI